METSKVALAKMVWGEARGCSTTEQAATIWCVLNRYDSGDHFWADTVEGITTQPCQFYGYDPSNPVDPDILALVEDVLDVGRRAGDALDAAACRPCLNDPTFMVERRESELALTADRLSGAITRSVGAFRSNFERLPERLIASTSGLDGKRHALTLASSRLEHQGRTMLSKPASDLGRAAASLDALSPLKVLARGYSIAYSDDGVATSAKTFKPGDAIRVRMADGNVAATVDTVE